MKFDGHKTRRMPNKRVKAPQQLRHGWCPCRAFTVARSRTKLNVHPQVRIEPKSDLYESRTGKKVHMYPNCPYLSRGCCSVKQSQLKKCKKCEGVHGCSMQMHERSLCCTTDRCDICVYVTLETTSGEKVAVDLATMDGDDSIADVPETLEWSVVVTDGWILDVNDKWKVVDVETPFSNILRAGQRVLHLKVHVNSVPRVGK